MNVTDLKELPQCELLSTLGDKISARSDTTLNFLVKLDEFRKRVSSEVRHINELFPEYTPHDELYHLSRLFHVADTVLCRERYEDMNSAELLILAISLYGHDWGMAVNEVEKLYITAGVLPESGNVNDLWILPDERHRFLSFAKKQGLKLDDKGHCKDIPNQLWSEYVRETHAFRSGERVRKYFEPIDGGIAEAAARVCEGHWLEFEELDNYQLYPTDFSVHRESVNLRALTVYVRLIDLLDLAEDRTPYVIWKFVAPRDKDSKMEWAKHRSLRPVTCPQYQEGRIILVDGSTDDHAVYAALQDLRIWTENQLRGCNDVMARMKDSRHRLDIYHIEWRVASRGFKPVSIQFDFDRERMFEVLSDEIYQGDPYVFLRELLQNSIDAIRRRHAILARNGIAPGNIGCIHVKVEHGKDGDAVISWKDDGSGMDEYIVRNYLAVAGRSFYRSADFEREGLNLDPISRFGVGILSCFMVSKRLEIETMKDPYIHPQSDPLKITIPAVNRQFRIEEQPRENSGIGTTVRVFVQGKKLSGERTAEPIQPLDVTTYLSTVAGFVEFPILVEESEQKTIVLHPKANQEEAIKRFGDDYTIKTIDLSYPWIERFLPQDVAKAHGLLSEEYWDIANDPLLSGYEGQISYLVPSRDECDFLSLHERAEVVEKGTRTGIYIRWHSDFEPGFDRLDQSTALSHSSKNDSVCSVYNDGILVATATAIEWGKIEKLSYLDVLPKPRIVVNIPKTQKQKTDLSRTQLIDTVGHWGTPILEGYFRHIYETYVKELQELEPRARLYQLARNAVFRLFGPEKLREMLVVDKWPVGIIEPDGVIKVVEWGEVAEDTMCLTPSPLRTELFESWKRWISHEEYTGPLNMWRGPRSIHYDLENYGVFSPQGIDTIGTLCMCALESSHRLAGAQFLQPPWTGDPPLLQFVYRRHDIPSEQLDIEMIVQKAVKDPLSLDGVEREVLCNFYSMDIPVAIFSKPYEDCFAYGTECLNLNHIITRTLLKLRSTVHLMLERDQIRPEQNGLLKDAFAALTGYRLSPSGFRDKRIVLDKVIESLRDLWILSQEFGIANHQDLQNLIPSIEDFVPGTVVTTTLDADEERSSIRLDKIQNCPPFGQVLE